MKSESYRLVIMILMMLATYSLAIADCVGTAPVTNAPNLQATALTSITVPITITGSAFQDIAAVSLKLDYDPSVLIYSGSAVPVGLPSGWSWVVSNTNDGHIMIGASWDNVHTWTLADGAVFINITFNFIGGTSTLVWDFSNENCEYANAAQASGVLGAGLYLCQDQTNYINGLIVFCDLSAGISDKTNVSCYGGANGSATVTAAGGTGPYLY